MRFQGMVLVTIVSLAILYADDQNNKKPQKESEKTLEQILQEKAERAYQADMAATEKYRARLKKSETAHEKDNHTEKKETTDNNIQKEKKIVKESKTDSEE